MAIIDTGWIDPTSIDTCNKFNNETFKSWSPKRLYLVKTEESRKLRHYDLSAVAYLRKNQKTGFMYASGFGFNIPVDATILKVEVRQNICGGDHDYGLQLNHLKLKTGASTSDDGVGNNVTNGLKLRRHSYCHYHGMMTPVIGDTKKDVNKFWGITITPNVVNSTNFGCVIQYKGLFKSLEKVYMNNIKMKIIYDDNKDKPVVKDNLKYVLTNVKEDPLTKKDGKFKVLNTYETSQKYDEPTPFKFYIRVENDVVKNAKGVKFIVDCRSSELVLISPDEKLLFEDSKPSRTIGQLNIPGTTDKKFIDNGFTWTYFERRVYINPSVVEPLLDKNESITADLILYRKDTSISKTTPYDVKKPLSKITFTIKRSLENIGYSMTILRRCTFTNNEANKGSAIYNTGRISIVDSKIYDNKTRGEDKNDCEFWDANMCRGFEFK